MSKHNLGYAGQAAQQHMDTFSSTLNQIVDICLAEAEKRDDADAIMKDQVEEIARLQLVNRNLLAACKMLVDAFEQDCWTEEVAFQMKNVRAAIAKAEGRIR